MTWVSCFGSAQVQDAEARCEGKAGTIRCVSGALCWAAAMSVLAGPRWTSVRVCQVPNPLRPALASP